MEVDTVGGSNETLGGKSPAQSNRSGLCSQTENLGCDRVQHSPSRLDVGEGSTRTVDSSKTLDDDYSPICAVLPESETIVEDDRILTAEEVYAGFYGEDSSPSCNDRDNGGGQCFGPRPSETPDCAVGDKFDEDALGSPTPIETEKESPTSGFHTSNCYPRDPSRETDDFNTQHPSLPNDLWPHHGRSSSYLGDWQRGVPCRESRGNRGDEENLSTRLLLAPEEPEPTGMGAGLLNLGNTCFMNAILQCFTHTVPLVDALRSCTHATPCTAEGFCVLCALREHINLCLASSGKIVSPTKLFDNLDYISSMFCKYQQEDAHEFLQCMLDRVESCCLGSNSGDDSSSLQDKNIVEHVFGGRLVSKLRCCNCGHCSQKFEPLFDLSLEIKEAETLQNALESFTKVEKMEDSDTKFTCENCKIEVTMEKQLMLDQVPSVVAMQLKRFKTDGGFIEKIGRHVELPLQLDFKPYTNCIDDTNVDLNYHLYAIVVHNGFLPTSGHYFCYIRSSPGTWHKLDDSKVIQLEEQFVLSQAAYILFYAKEGTPWFSTFFESEKLNADPSVSNTSPKSVLENIDVNSPSNPGAFKSVADDNDGGFISNPDEAGNDNCEVRIGEDVKVGGPSSQLRCGAMNEGNPIKTYLEETMETQALMPTDIHMVDAFVAPEAEDRISCKEEVGTVPFLEENNCDRVSDNIRGSNAHRPSTPSRSFPGKLPEDKNCLGRDQLKVEENRANGKRSASKREAKDSHRKEAMRYVNKRMSGSRGTGFSKALKLSPCKRVSPRSRQKTPMRATVGVTR